MTAFGDPLLVHPISIIHDGRSISGRWFVDDGGVYLHGELGRKWTWLSDISNPASLATIMLYELAREGFSDEWYSDA
jgi:hypothetical protein